jgi:potassium uptake TrkH family protein
VGIRRSREQFLLFIYQNKEPVLKVLRSARILASLLVLAIFSYYYGFPHPQERQELLLKITNAVFGFFIISYFVRVFFSLNSWTFIKNSIFEAILIFLLLVDIISTFIFGFKAVENLFIRLDIENFNALYILFIHLYLLLLVGLEAVKLSADIPSIKLKPATTFVYTYVLLILLGTGALMLPEMTTQPGSLRFIDALFTSTSATCVTGLIVVDTATAFTFKGQLVIMILFQLGALGVLTFATFFAMFLKKGLGIGHQALIRDFTSGDSLFDSKRLLIQIITYTLLIESIGIVLLYILWDVNTPFYDDPGEMLFQSAFHSISAFCNAGFSLMSNGLAEDYLQNAYILHIVIALLIVFGSLGFPAMRDIFSLTNIRARIKAPWKNWKLSTRIAVWVSAALIALGTVGFLLLEQSHTLAGKGPFQQWVNSFFQSVTTRTAGFNTVDIGALATPTVILFIFLMFIGGSSGSTGGGIKTSTFVIIFLAVVTTIRGKKYLELGGRSISFSMVNKAFTIFIFSASYILIGTFFLSVFEPDIPILDLVFEEVSAFCTVGLSRGITADLSIPSKVVLLISMYIGRVGTLTLAFALASRVNSNNYRYPSAHIMVG